MNTYDSMIIFESSMSEEGLQKAIVRIKDEIGKLGGTSGDSKVMGKHTFARPMKKKNDGIYVKMGFDMAPDKIDALKGRFKLNEEVFRVQITRKSELDNIEMPKISELMDNA